MKKTIIGILGMLALGAVPAGAAPLFEDDFDSYTTSDLGEWRNEDPSGSGKIWRATSGISGKRSAQGGGTDFNEEGTYDVTLVSPAITLPAGKNYKVDFIWQQSTTAVITNHCNDLLVQVRVPGGQWTTVFAADDPELCAASGVIYPWGASGNWEINHSIVDISDFAGKTVEVGFTWRKKEFDNMYSNVATIDDVVIDEYTPATGPVADLSLSRYTFPTTWVGAISNSEAITLTNTGKGNLKISGIEGLDGTDFECMLDAAGVDLAPNYSLQFNVRYTPSVSGSSEATMKINVAGGNVAEIALKGTKKMAPEGYSVENFEDGSFPPVGWSKTGNWNALNSSFSGDRCAYVNLTMSDVRHELTSPRLDLSTDQDHFVAFSYINQLAYAMDDLYGVENYVDLELSRDGGSTWTTVWSLNDYAEELSQAQVSLDGKGSNNCYLRWAYYIPDLDPTIYDYEYSNFFIDAIVLPPLYGAGGIPESTEVVSPADNATDIINNGVVLSWKPTLFATGYKVYLGTSASNFDILNGVETEETSYATPRLEYSTRYFWQVVPVNTAGSPEVVPTWSFTTMADQSIKTFPFSQDFEEPDNELPLGWATSAQGSTKWQISKIGPFDGKQIAFASGTTSATEAILTTPEIILPADSPMMVSFYWANNAPAALYIDETGTARNTTTKFDGNDGCYFEIAEASGSWKQLALISEESKYWVREAVSLADYAGKVVQLRWRYNLQYGNGRRGISLDNVLIESETDAAPAYFNVTEFNFGEVNANTVASSKKAVTLTNGGLKPVKITGLSYGDERFTSSLEAGQELQPNKAVIVDVTFSAGNAASATEGTMTVTFEGGKRVSLPLKAVALPATTLYFDFEDDEHGSMQPEGLTTVDVDNQLSVMSSVIYYPHRGERTSFLVLNVTRDYADWRNVYPHSGDQVLAAFRTQSDYVTADDWIISPKMTATAKSQFRFFGKSYGTTDEFNDFKHHQFEVWVSTSGKAIADFTDKVKKTTELAYDANQKFTEYTIDLSAYDGQEIYVGLRHIGPLMSYVAFFDDFYYENFAGFDTSGITMVPGGDDTEAVYYDLQGLRVDFHSAAPGIYVRVADGKTSKVVKH